MKKMRGKVKGQKLSYRGLGSDGVNKLVHRKRSHTSVVTIPRNSNKYIKIVSLIKISSSRLCQHIQHMHRAVMDKDAEDKCEARICEPVRYD